MRIWILGIMAILAASMMEDVRLDKELADAAPVKVITLARGR